MNKIQRSFAIMKASFSVIMQNKTLLVFPLLATLALFALVPLLISPIVLQPTGHGFMTGAHWDAVFQSVFTKNVTALANDNSAMRMTPAGMAYFGFIYFMSMFLATFFNVAFYHEIIEALSQRPVSVSSGFRFAVSKLGSIFVWSLFAGFIGWLIRLLEQRFGLIGRLIMRVIGVAWAVASVFAIPVLVTEEITNPVDVLKKSAQSIRETWGESLLGYVGLGVVQTLAVFVSLVLAGAGVFFAVSINSIPLIVGIFVVWLTTVFVFSYFTGVAGHVYRAGLYLFASSRQVVAPFREDHFAHAWKSKAK